MSDNLQLTIPRKTLRMAALVGALGAAGYLAGRAHAAIPSTDPLTFTGVIKTGGAPLTGDRDIRLSVCNQQSGGSCQCQTGPGLIAVDDEGRFQIVLPTTCKDALTTVMEPWVEIQVSGSSIGRIKVGAVPFALEAQTAADSTGDLESRLAALEQRSAPVGLIGTFASACPAGWTLCDGTGACPDLRDAYLKGGSAFAAKSGTNLHDHALSTGTVSGGGHRHTAGALAADSNGGHEHHAYFDFSTAGGQLYGIWDAVPGWTPNGGPGAPLSAGTPVGPLGSGVRTTTTGSHPHTVSGNTELSSEPLTLGGSTISSSHEPVHATMVFCMKD